MKWFTSDLHFAHPFVATLRGYALPGYACDESIRQQAEHDGRQLKDCVDWRKHDADIVQAINTYVGKEDELYASSRMLEKLASVFGEVGRVGITEIRDGRGNNPHTVFLSHFQWREDFTQSKPLGAVSTNWNAPELAEYALPRMNNTLLLHGHTHAHDPLEFGRHHNEINVGLDAWWFKPVNEAELLDDWLHAASSAV